MHLSRRSLECELIANANDDFVSLTPTSAAPAALVVSRWAAVLPDPLGIQPPLIWE